MGFIANNQAQILRNNSLIDIHTLDAAQRNGVSRYFYASSACVYPEYWQNVSNCLPLREDDAYPAQPQDSYGWEKLMGERLCIHYSEEFGIKTRMARFHNIFGPEGIWDGGREKAPAALCRKIAEAKLTGKHEIEIWGDGEQTRSFCYIDDCITGIFKLMRSDWHAPLNIGQHRLITINALTDLIAEIADVKIEKKYVPGAQGVRGRNSNNERLRQILGWEPTISLEKGLRFTYSWISDRVSEKINLPHPLEQRGSSD